MKKDVIEALQDMTTKELRSILRAAEQGMSERSSRLADFVIRHETDSYYRGLFHEALLEKEMVTELCEKLNRGEMR